MEEKLKNQGTYVEKLYKQQKKLPNGKMMRRDTKTMADREDVQITNLDGTTEVIDVVKPEPIGNPDARDDSGIKWVSPHLERWVTQDIVEPVEESKSKERL